MSLYCNIIKKSMFVSHYGIGLCCVNHDKHHGINPSEFWHGDVRKKALHQMNESQKVKGCDLCYSTEEKKMPSSRTFANSYNKISERDAHILVGDEKSNLSSYNSFFFNVPEGINYYSFQIDDELSNVLLKIQSYEDKK